MIKHLEQDNHDLYREIGLSSEKWCLFIMNDNFNPEVVYGGSHWYLLLFNPIVRQFFVFDSLAGSTVNDRIIQVNYQSNILCVFKKYLLNFKL